MKKRIKNMIRLALPVAAVLLTIALYYGIPESGKQKKVSHPYFIYFLGILLAVYVVAVIVSGFVKSLRIGLLYKSAFYAGIITLLNVLNLLFTKTTVLPTIYFPSFDRIFAVFVENKVFLLENILASFKLLLAGFLWGAVVGFCSGVALGFSKKFAYWINPVIKVIGPIPTTAWIPIALSCFPTTRGANIFLIAFAVWFPVTLMTSSGIQSTPNVYFEISRTLGASTLFQVFKVAIPNAMPSIFLGIFYGTCSSFITLMAVEMNGNASGVGWYISWQKGVMMYDGVYAGLILIALICSAILTILFKVRDRVLVWQKGVIKW